MLSTSETALLRAVLDRLLPPDLDPGALQLGTGYFVIERLAADVLLAAEIAAGLAAVESQAPL